MNPHEFSQDILATIEKQHIEPRPRWLVLLIRAAWWAMAFCTVVLGGLAFASILFFVREGSIPSERPFPAFLRGLPVLWLLAFGVLAILAYLDVRATPKGYRYPHVVLMLAVVFGSVCVGTGVYAAGYETVPHQFLGERLPGYNVVSPDPSMAWHQPEAGRYTGVILSTTTHGFLLRDASGEEYEVRVSTTSRWLLPREPAPHVLIKTLAAPVKAEEDEEDHLTLIEARPLYRVPRPVLERSAERRLREEPRLREKPSKREVLKERMRERRSTE